MQLFDLFQDMLEKPEQVTPHLDSSAMPAKEIEEMTVLVDLADRLRERTTSVSNAEVALSRAKARVLASVPVTPALSESPLSVPAPRPVVRPAAAVSAPWQNILDIFRTPAVPAWATAGITILLVLFVSIYMSVVSSANAMPGDATYPIKLFVERVSLALTFDPERKSERLETQNKERLQEVREVLENHVVVRVTFSEAIQGREGDYWIIGGIKVLVEEGAEFLESLGAGAIVYVEGIASADGVILHGVIRAPTPTPVIVSTPLPDSLLPGLNLESLPTDTPAPIPTKKPTPKPVRRIPVRPKPTRKPKPTAIPVATATPTTPGEVILTPTVDLPPGTLTATPPIGETPEITFTPTEIVVATDTPDPTLPTATPTDAPVATPKPGETTTPSETEVPTPNPDASHTPEVTDTPTEPTATPLPEDTPTPVDDTPTPSPVDTPTPVSTNTAPTNTPVPPANTPVLSPTDTPAPPQPTNTPVPPQPTNTPVPPQPTNTPVPPQPTSTPVPPAPTSTPEPPAPTNTAIPPQPTPTL